MVPCARKRTVVTIAEDDPDDRLLLQDAIKESSPSVEVHFVADGAEMLDFLYHRGTYANTEVSHPELILLDLNMPRMDGMEVLRAIKQDKTLCSIPVVVLTTSQAPEQIALSYKLGGNGFITKPDSYTELVSIMSSLNRYWFQTVTLPD